MFEQILQQKLQHWAEQGASATDVQHRVSRRQTWERKTVITVSNSPGEQLQLFE